MITAIRRPAPVSHPFDRLRLIVKVAKSDSLLAREQRDVIVRHAHFNGITDEGDPVRRIRREPLEGLEYPEFFDREQGFRRAHVHEDAREPWSDWTIFFGRIALRKDESERRRAFRRVRGGLSRATARAAGVAPGEARRDRLVRGAASGRRGSSGPPARARARRRA